MFSLLSQTVLCCFSELQSAETADTVAELEPGEEETKLSSDTKLRVVAVCDVKGPEEQEEECEKRDVKIVKTGAKEEEKTEKEETEKTAEEEQGARRKKIEEECDNKEVEYEDQYEKFDVSTRIRKTKGGKRKKKAVESGESEETCSEKRKNNRRMEGMVDRNWKKTEQKKEKNKMSEPRREEFHTLVVYAGIFR
jgi:hypothetical protein